MSFELASHEQKLPAVGRRLPVHGFVLAGGKSSRMGRDKALLPFRGRPMVEIAVEKLRGFCAGVSIAGNREDLSGFAPVVPEARVDCGPAAGIEAGLRACTQPWALFVPVDVPLVPGELLRRWAEAVLAEEKNGVRASYMFAVNQRQPSICFMRQDCLATFQVGLREDIRRLAMLFERIDLKERDSLWTPEATWFSPMLNPSALQMEYWFSNVNTQNELEVAELWSEE